MDVKAVIYFFRARTYVQLPWANSTNGKNWSKDCRYFEQCL